MGKPLNLKLNANSKVHYSCLIAFINLAECSYVLHARSCSSFETSNAFIISHLASTSYNVRSFIPSGAGLGSLKKKFSMTLEKSKSYKKLIVDRIQNYKKTF